MPKRLREVLKFAAGICLGFVSVWLSVHFSLDAVSIDANPAESGSNTGIIAMVISALSLLIERTLEFFKSWTSWKLHDSQIDLGKLELQLNQDQLKLEYDRLQLEQERFQLDRERFEWQRAERSLSSQSQAVTYGLAGATRPEVVTLGEGPDEYPDAPDLSKGQARDSETESRIQRR